MIPRVADSNSYYQTSSILILFQAESDLKGAKLQSIMQGESGALHTFSKRPLKQISCNSEVLKILLSPKQTLRANHLIVLSFWWGTDVRSSFTGPCSATDGKQSLGFMLQCRHWKKVLFCKLKGWKSHQQESQ